MAVRLATLSDATSLRNLYNARQPALASEYKGGLAFPPITAADMQGMIQRAVQGTMVICSVTGSTRNAFGVFSPLSDAWHCSALVTASVVPATLLAEKRNILRDAAVRLFAARPLPSLFVTTRSGDGLDTHLQSGFAGTRTLYEQKRWTNPSDEANPGPIIIDFAWVHWEATAAAWGAL